MSRARGTAVVAGLVAAAILPTPALAANKSVGVADNFFSPDRVAVSPGESVTWSNPGSGQPHNVVFEDGPAFPAIPSTGPWTQSRTFPTSGAFPYFCEIHGRAGGIGMAGVVYVNTAGNAPPRARLLISPVVAAVGQAVSFDGSESKDLDGTIATYEWDLNGDGTFETNTGASPMASRSYTSPATLTPKLRVTDNQGETEVATQTLRINAAPSASLTISPSPAETGQTVTFNGSGSSDSDGTISKYEWDLDGDGSFETNTFNTSTASRSYPAAATLTVKLRVTDSDGASTETTGSLQINAAPAPPPTPQQQPTLQKPTPQPSVTPQSQPTKPKGKPGKCSKLKGKKRAACIRKTCGKLKGAKRKACVKKVTRKR